MSGLTDSSNKALKKKKRLLYVVYSEASIRERLKVCRNTSGALQVEWFNFITANSLTLPHTPRLHYEGTANGEFLGPVAWPAYDSPDVWSLPTKAKKDIITHKVLAGGPTMGENATAEEKKEAEKEMAFIRAMKKEAEPMFWHSTPLKLWEEILFDYNIVAVLDLTPGDGVRALAALRRRIPYAGVAMNAAHRDHLLMHLDKTVLKQFQVEGDKLYQPAFAELLKHTPLKEGEEQTTPAASRKRKKVDKKDTTPDENKVPKTGEEGDGTAADAKKALLARIANLSAGKGKKPRAETVAADEAEEENAEADDPE